LAFYDRLAPAAVLAQLVAEEPNYEFEQLRAYVKRFYQLWSRNQWKRERYAPSFHLDDYNVDPRSWLRFPILSGGFGEELAALLGVLAKAPRKFFGEIAPKLAERRPLGSSSAAFAVSPTRCLGFYGL
nr:hypothetical protein [Tanacetum cinerariifolium]